MEYRRIVVVQVERVGYLCARCNRFHRHRDPEYLLHLVAVVEGLTFYVDTVAFGIDDATGDALQLPLALGLAAMHAAELVEG